MSNRSFFEFNGPIDRLSVRIELFQIGIPSLDFQTFNQNESGVEKPINTKSDEISFGWMQKVGDQEGRVRRLFTLTEDDELPDHLKLKKTIKSKQSEINQTLLKSDKEMTSNNDYIVFRKSKVPRENAESKEMYILGNLGSMEIIDARNIELLARISLREKENKLIVEPPIDPMNGLKMETKFGDFVMKMRIFDKLKDQEEDNDMTMKKRSNRPSITSIPESESFAVARDGFVESTVLVNLVKGVNFFYNEGITIDYKVRVPAGVAIKSENQTGRTQRFSGNDNDNGDFNLSEVLEFVFEHRVSDERHLSPLLMLRLFSVDYWGRQYIAGYGSTYISLDPGRSRSVIHCWRPVVPDSLYEQFLGQSIDLNYYGVNEKDKNLRVGANGQSSGEVLVETSCVAQSRQYMARDILYQLKYGSKMADMGLRSDFYQRIVKVLMDFEEARAKLHLARGLKK